MNHTFVLTTSNRSIQLSSLRRHHSLQKRVFLILVIVLASSILQPQIANAQSCTQLLNDGSFETGTDWQSKNNDGFPLLSSQLAHSGTYGAYLGGRNNITDRLSTIVTLPQQKHITMNLWWQLQSQENATKHGDRLSILIADKQGIPLQFLTELSGRNATNDWRSLEFDLSRFAGQAIQLQFLASTDMDQITDFFLDDVEIIACDATN